MTSVLFIAGAFVMGTIFGSYLATLAIRWPRRQSTVTGRSRCDECGSVLAPMELIPLVSYMRGFGRCRHCRKPIDPIHPIMEVLSGTITALALFLLPTWLGLAAAAIGCLVLLIAVLDLRHFWIPDVLSASVGLAGIGLAATGVEPGFPGRVIGALAGFAVLWSIASLYRKLNGREGMGAGDPKFLAAIGAWMGWQQLPLVLLGASAIGLAAALVLRLAGKDISRTTPFPLGTLMAVVAWPLWLFTLLQMPDLVLRY